VFGVDLQATLGFVCLTLTSLVPTLRVTAIKLRDTLVPKLLLGEPSEQSSSFASREAGASCTEFPSRSLGTSANAHFSFPCSGVPRSHVARGNEKKR
jgi:hypothetical protein